MILFVLLCTWPALTGGVYACFLEGMRTGKLTTGRLWSGFRHWWSFVWVTVVIAVASVLCFPCMCVLIGIPLVLGVGTLGWLAYFRIADKGRGGGEALTFAWNALRGRLWMMLVYTLIVAVVMNAGVMGMYIGVVVTAPFGIMAYAAAYEALRKKMEEGA